MEEFSGCACSAAPARCSRSSRLSIHACLIHEYFKVRGDDVRPAVHRHLGHLQTNQRFLWINPEISAPISCPAILSGRSDNLGLRNIHQDPEAQTITVRTPVYVGKRMKREQFTR